MDKLRELLGGLREDTGCYRAIVEAYCALFEDAASTATHKTKRVIRELFPQLANKWDSIATDGQGNPILTMGHKQQTVIELFERRIRDNFFHSGENQKFEPGVARIAYGELKMDNLGQETHKLDSLKKIIKMISDAHANEYDADLNGLSYSDLDARFGTTMQQVDDKIKKELKETKYTPSDYIIEEIPDLETAKKFYEYTYPKSRWCLTHREDMWDAYTADGMNKVYFAYRPNFKETEIIRGPNAPLDEYGLSLICIIVTPFENIRAAVTRWNHQNGGTDQTMDAMQLSKLLGGNVFELCPPPPKPERHIERIDEDSVKIGDQIWMSHNLQMPADREHGIYMGRGYWSDYLPDNVDEIYFTWEAAMRVAKEYGNGWRLPSREDWMKLSRFCGGDAKAGNHLKSSVDWWTGSKGYDTYGFDGKPYGLFQKGGDGPDDYDYLYEEGDSALFWSSSLDDDTRYRSPDAEAYCFELSANKASAGLSKRACDDGLPIRLVKDA